MIEVEEIELRLLLDAIHYRYHYDFRHYSPASIRRRVRAALVRLQCATVSALQDRILHDARAFQVLLEMLTIHVSDLFRDPEYFAYVRREVCPLLATWPSIKVWVAGCSGGEEVWSLAILLAETGLLSRSLVYATDIDQRVLDQARSATYDLHRFAQFSENYQRAGGSGTLSDWYTADYGHARFDARLRERVVFADHDLATDAVFSEVQLVSCRNVLIYFDRPLQDRAIGLFADSLCRGGILWLGPKETIRFSAHVDRFEVLAADERVHRRR